MKPSRERDNVSSEEDDAQDGMPCCRDCDDPQVEDTKLPDNAFAPKIGFPLEEVRVGFFFLEHRHGDVETVEKKRDKADKDK